MFGYCQVLTRMRLGDTDRAFARAGRSTHHQSRVDKALDLLKAGLGPFVQRESHETGSMPSSGLCGVRLRGVRLRSLRQWVSD